MHQISHEEFMFYVYVLLATEIPAIIGFCIAIVLTRKQRIKCNACELPTAKARWLLKSSNTHLHLKES